MGSGKAILIAPRKNRYLLFGGLHRFKHSQFNYTSKNLLPSFGGGGVAWAQAQPI